jgi:uncharacterized protein DUF2844
MKLRAWLFTMALAAWCFSASAFAVLGGDAASIEADQVQMKGTLQTTQMGSVTVHEIQAASGTAIKEYVSPAGTVFAVTWAGPSLPDLRQLLGSYFTPYVEAVKSQRTGRGPINVKQPDLVVQSGGQMRALFGRAYIPSMVPQGVTADQIK